MKHSKGMIGTIHLYLLYLIAFVPFTQLASLRKTTKKQPCADTLSQKPRQTNTTKTN